MHTIFDFISRLLDALMPPLCPAVGAVLPVPRAPEKPLFGFCKGGASAPKAPKEKSVTKYLYYPQVPTIIEPPAPPAEVRPDTSSASMDARKRAAARRGMSSTLLAGETGGYTPEGKKTLLG